MILRWLKEVVSRLSGIVKLDRSFTFPYSSDANTKREQIWDNLRKGILFEDHKILMPWLTPYNQLYRYKEKRFDTEDRTSWHLGKRTILDGYEGEFEVLKWVYHSWNNPIVHITENLGEDAQGEKKFHYLARYITTLLGEPTKTEIERWGSCDLGIIQWKHGTVMLSLIGIEHFQCQYTFTIGLQHESIGTNRIHNLQLE